MKNETNPAADAATLRANLRADRAREVARQVRELVESLDDLVFLMPEERARLAPAANVPDDFIAKTADAMDDTTFLGGCTKATPASLRSTIDVSKAYGELAADLALLNRGVRDTIQVQRADAGTEALRVYAVAQKLTRPSDATASVATLRNLRRALGRGPRPKRRREGNEE